MNERKPAKLLLAAGLALLLLEVIVPVAWLATSADTTLPTPAAAPVRADADWSRKLASKLEDCARDSRFGAVCAAIGSECLERSADPSRSWMHAL